MRKFREYRFVVGETHKDTDGKRNIVDAALEVSVVSDCLQSAVRKAFINTGYKEVIRVL